MQPDPTRPPCIAVVGSTMMDLIAYLDRAPSAGETVIGRRFSQGFGGKGANQAVMAARLGAQVAMVACVGDDAFGQQTLDTSSPWASTWHTCDRYPAAAASPRSGSRPMAATAS